MAPSVKKRPASIPNISDSLNMINGDGSQGQISDSKNEFSQIQTGASYPETKNNVSNASPNLKKSTKDTQIIFRTTEDNKNSLKGFFATYGITLSKGIQLACFYLEQQIKAGSVEINSVGLITKQERR